MGEKLTLEDICKMTVNYQPDKNILYFACALAGETGEFCNLVKKMERDGRGDIKKMGYELADIIAYVILNARLLGIDIEAAIIEKNKIVKDRQL